MERPGTAFNKLPVHGIFHTASTVITMTDLVVQLYCVFLIIRVSGSNMRQYRRFLLFSTVCDVCFAASYGAGQPRHFDAEFPYACTPLTGPLRWLGDSAARAWVGVSWFAATALVSSQYFALVYRMVIITDWRWLKTNIARPPLFALGTAVCLAIAFTLGYIEFYTVSPDRRELNGSNGTELGYITDADTAMLCVRVEPYTVKATAGTLLLFAASEMFFLSCAAWIIWKVNKQRAFSQRSKSMHVQLTRLLIAQMLSPVICMLVPIAIILLNGFSSLSFGVFPIYLAELLLTVFPMVNALLTISFVAPYRRFTLDLLRNSVKVSAIDFSSSGAAPARAVHFNAATLI